MSVNDMFIEYDSKVIEFKRKLINAQLKKCTEDEIKFFNRMYKSIDDIPEDKMRHAFFQCRNTVLKKYKEK